MKRKLLVLLFASILLLVACGQESKNIENNNEGKDNLVSELELANQQIESLEKQLNDANEKIIELENGIVETTEKTDEQVESTVEYKMGEISGYYRVDAPNEIGLYIDESMIIESDGGKPTVYPITDYTIYENKLIVDILNVDFEQEYIFKTTKIYTIYEENNGKSIRESLNPTQENVRFHYEEQEIPEFIEQNINYDQYRDKYLKWEKEQN